MIMMTLNPDSTNSQNNQAQPIQQLNNVATCNMMIKQEPLEEPKDNTVEAARQHPLNEEQGLAVVSSSQQVQPANRSRLSSEEFGVIQELNGDEQDPQACDLAADDVDSDQENDILNDDDDGDGDDIDDGHDDDDGNDDSSGNNTGDGGGASGGCDDGDGDASIDNGNGDGRGADIDYDGDDGNNTGDGGGGCEDGGGDASIDNGDGRGADIDDDGGDGNNTGDGGGGCEDGGGDASIDNSDGRGADIDDDGGDGNNTGDGGEGCDDGDGDVSIDNSDGRGADIDDDDDDGDDANNTGDGGGASGGCDDGGGDVSIDNGDGDGRGADIDDDGGNGNTGDGGGGCDDGGEDASIDNGDGDGRSISGTTCDVDAIVDNAGIDGNNKASVDDDVQEIVLVHDDVPVVDISDESDPEYDEQEPNPSQNTPVKKPLQCVSCNKVCYINETSSIYRPVLNGERSFVCIVCNFKTFKQRHNEVYSANNKNPNHESAQGDNVDDTAVADRLTNSGNGPRCDFCLKDFNTERGLQSHVRQVHGSSRPFMCCICRKQCTTEHTLKSHFTHKHGRTGPHRCKVCSQEFMDWDHQQQHNFQFYECEVCQKMFNWKKHLIRHKAVVHHLNMCSNSNVSVHDLRFVASKNHMKQRHDQRKPFQCSLCDETFQCETTLRDHEIQHRPVEKNCHKPGEQCSVCDTINRLKNLSNRK